MKTTKTQLSSALKLASLGLDTRQLVEQSQNYVFKDNAIITYNKRVMVKVAFEHDLEGSVDGRTLASFIVKAKENLEITCEDKFLLFKSVGSRAKIVKSAVKLPYQEVNIPQDFNKIPENFMYEMQNSKFCLSKDSKKPMLNCFNIKDNHIITCDGYRILRTKLSADFPDVMIDIKEAICLFKLCELVSHYSFDGTFLHFKNEHGLIFSIRNQNLSYPDISKLLDVDGDTFNIDKEAAKVLDLATIFTNSNTVAIDIKDKLLNVSSNGVYGNFNEDIIIEDDGESKFFINPKFFAEALTRFSSFTSGEKSLKFSNDDSVHVLAKCSA